MAITKHVLHVRSNETVTSADGQVSPKLPTSGNVQYGEIAVNYADDYETLSIRNSADEIVTFSSDKKNKCLWLEGVYEDGTPVLESRRANSSVTALGSRSVAEGRGTYVGVDGAAAHAEGVASSATSVAAHAEGAGTLSNAIQAHAEGMGTSAMSESSHAEGAFTMASGITSHAEGSGTTTSADAAHAEGVETRAYAEGAHTEGKGTYVYANYGHAEGSATTVSGVAAHAEGSATTANGVASHAEGWASSATASYSHAEGRQTLASEQYSHAEGWTSKATSVGAHAEGRATSATGTYSHAEGYSSKATNNAAHAEGQSTSAIGVSSHAEGRQTSACSDTSHAEGSATTAVSVAAHAEGIGSVASGNASHAEGSGTTTSGSSSHAEGQLTKAMADYCHAEGDTTSAMSNSTHAEGYQTLASGFASHAEGADTRATSSYAHAEGNTTSATSQGAHAEGQQTLASNDNAHAEGRATSATAYGAHAEGRSTRALGQYSHAEGYATSATSNHAHSEGHSTLASAEDSHAEGSGTTASGNAAHAEGFGTFVQGNYSHAEGMGSRITGYGSHAEGSATTVSGNIAHAEGIGSSALTNAAHAEGYKSRAGGSGLPGEGASHVEGDSTVAFGYASHAEGWNTSANTDTYTNAQGVSSLTWSSHAEGRWTLANGNASHAEGEGCVTLNDYEHAQGKFNISRKDDVSSARTQFTIGCGSDDENRANMMEVRGNGDIYITTGNTDYLRGDLVKLQDMLGGCKIVNIQPVITAAVNSGRMDGVDWVTYQNAIIDYLDNDAPIDFRASKMYGYEIFDIKPFRSGLGLNAKYGFYLYNELGQIQITASGNLTKGYTFAISWTITLGPDNYKVITPSNLPTAETWSKANYLLVGEISLTTAVTVTEGSVVRFHNGASVSSTGALTLHDVFIDNPDNHQIFDSNLEIIGYFANERILPEWWGAKADGVTDDSAAINLAIKYGGTKEVFLGGTNYYVNSTIRLVGSNCNPNTLKYIRAKGGTLGNAYSFQGGEESGEEWGKRFVCMGNIIGGPGIPELAQYCGVLKAYTYQGVVDVRGYIVSTNDAPAVVGCGKHSTMYFNALVKDSVGGQQNRTTSGTGSTEIARSGVGFAFQGGNENNITIGHISGFDKGFYVSDKYMNLFSSYLYGYGNKFDIEVINANFPFYFERKLQRNSFFNGNTINYYGCARAGAAETIPNNATFFTVDWIYSYSSRNRDGFRSNTFNFSYIQGAYWVLFNIEGVQDSTFNLNGNFLSDVMVKHEGTVQRVLDVWQNLTNAGSITTASTGTEIFHQKLHSGDGTTYKCSLFNATNCYSVTFNTPEAFAFPSNALQVYNSSHVKFNGHIQEPRPMISTYGLYNPAYFAFKSVRFMAMNGGNVGTQSWPTTDYPVYELLPENAANVYINTGTPNATTMYGTTAANTIEVNYLKENDASPYYMCRVGFPGADTGGVNTLKFLNPTHPSYASPTTTYRKLWLEDTHGTIALFNSFNTTIANTLSTI